MVTKLKITATMMSKNIPLHNMPTPTISAKRAQQLRQCSFSLSGDEFTSSSVGENVHKEENLNKNKKLT